MKNIFKIKSDLKKNGFSVIKKFYSLKKCDLIKKKLEKVLEQRIKKKNYIGKKNTIVLYNYFLEDKQLGELIFNKRINSILTKIIEKNYGLTSASARNKVKFSLNNKKFKKQSASGNKWHTDNRYISGMALSPSISYFIITAIDNMKKENGCTLYLPKSHLMKKKISKNFKTKKYSFLEADKGSIIILDTNLAHKAGFASELDRWAIFNMYSPWFVKPYYEYYKIKKIPNFSKEIKKVLHFNYIPPTDFNRIRNTVKK